MASIKENFDFWARYDWSQRGDEWSGEWGGSRGLWSGALFPRVARFLPANTVVEIAPGAGRMTEFLSPLARRLFVVDLVPACLELCRVRFARERHIEYVTTDGKSLPGILDRSVDFAFSFDSLVHADMDVLSGYLAELDRVLSNEGAAFLHHSNFGRFVDRATGALSVNNVHWRDPSVCAESVARTARELGLLAVVQENVNWCGPDLTDTFTLVVRASGPLASEPRRVDNVDFMQEAEAVRQKLLLWSPDATSSSSG
jgi:SAM-dependent methyltransferase